MIQDISPYRLDMAYRGTVPAPDDCFFSFRGEDVLLRDMGDGRRSLPSFRGLGHPAGMGFLCRGHGPALKPLV